MKVMMHVGGPQHPTTVNSRPIPTCLNTARPCFRLKAVPEDNEIRAAEHSASELSCISRRNAVLSSVVVGFSSLVMPAQASDAASPIILTQRPTTSVKLGFEERVEEFTLANGMHFIVLPRDTAPVVSMNMYADVGAFQEDEGQTGLAHLLEHMAFKGTRRVGAQDWKREAPLLDAMDEVFYEQRALKRLAAEGGYPTVQERINKLDERLKQLQAEAGQLIVPNAYGALLSRSGAVGLNASTSHDSTRYYMSLPVNKLELWFALESERFRAPVFRELYSEKKVIEEERRLRVDSAPLGRFQQEFANRAMSNNYRRPVIGWEQDFDGLGRKEVVDFFSKYYGPKNLTVAVVGDVTTEQVYQLAEKYWGGWRNDALTSTVMPGSQGSTDDDGPLVAFTSSAGLTEIQNSYAARSETESRTYSDTAVGGPLVYMGYQRPALTDKTGPILQMTSELLTGTRTARLTKQLVINDRSLLGVRCLANYPGEKYPGLCLVAAVPQQGQSPESAEKAVEQELEKFLDKGPSVRELEVVRKSTKTSLLASALSNGSMASLLTSYRGLTGDWKSLLQEIELMDNLTPEDIRTVSQAIFNPGNKFSAYAYPKTAA